MRSDRTPFRNTGECVKYASQGGVPIPIAHPQIVLSRPVQPGMLWSDVSFVGSGFAQGTGLILTLASVPSGPVSSALYSYGTDPSGGFTLSGSAWAISICGPSCIYCIGYGGFLLMTATDTLGSVASVTFQSPC
jgi:hypothetical protein